MSGTSHESSAPQDERPDPTDLADLRNRFADVGHRAWRETKLTAAASWSQIQRLIAYLRGGWTAHRLERKYLAAQIALGERIDAAELGDPKLRARLADLNERRQSFVAARSSTRAIDTERRGLLVRLAAPFLEEVEPPPAAQREHRQALAQKMEIADRLDRHSERRASLFPADFATRIRTALGLGAIVILLMLIVSSFRGDDTASGLLLPPQIDLESLQPLASFPLPPEPAADAADVKPVETREFNLDADAILPARKVTVTFVNGLADGEVRSVDGEGRLISIERFRRGRLSGLRQRFYPEGEQRFSELRFVDGVARGTEIVWFPDGTVASRTDIVDGVPHGDSVIYFANVRKCITMSYVKGQLHGQRLHYRPDETCFAIVDWREGAAVSQKFLQIELTASDVAAIKQRGAFSTRLVDHWK